MRDWGRSAAVAVTSRKSGHSVRVLRYVCLFLLVWPNASCGGGSQAKTVQSAPAYPQIAGVLANASTWQQTPTFDGSGQAVHPGIVRFAAPWHGFRYWMVVTPYPYSDKKIEDPSILASNDGRNWQVPEGLTNPVAQPTTAFLADGDLLYDSASDQLWLYYVEQNVGSHTRVLRKMSADGVHWSTEEQVINALDYELVSPSVEKIGEKFYMWSVNSGPVGSCAETMKIEMRTSMDGRTWSAPQAASISTPGYRVWHIEVIDVPAKNEKWMLATASALTVPCVRQTVQLFARSSDGLNWEAFDKVALAPGSGWDSSHIYRSTLLYDDTRNTIQVWYSGRNGSTGVWHIGYTEANYTEFLNWLRN